MIFSLSADDFKEHLQLPVNPSEYKIQTGQLNSVINIHEYGEVSVLGGKKLRTVTLSSLFPRSYSNYCEYSNVPDPFSAVDMINNWREKKKIIRLIIQDSSSASDSKPDKAVSVGEDGQVNMNCTIEDFEYGQKGGSGDVEFTLSLKEYENKGAIQVNKKDPAVLTKGSRASSKKMSSYYEVKKGDTLYSIAKKRTGSMTNWKAIYEKNKTQIGNDPNKLKAGMRLVIPN